MPFNEALFWFGITGFGTGLYFWVEGTVKRLHSISLTVIGALACAYSVYRHYHPEFPVIRLWVILLIITWAFLGYTVYLAQFRRLPLAPIEKPKEPSKLIIQSANFAAWSGQGKCYDVTRFLRSIISGDSLVFGPIERDRFWIEDENLVPNDPLNDKPKRLEVTYSYDGEQSKTIRRAEHGRLVLPEDSTIEWQEKQIEQLKAAQPKPVQYPVPELRGKIVSMVSELQGFLGAHGEEPRLPEVHKEPGESNDDFLVRWRARPTEPIMQWRAKFLGDYRQEFKDKVSRLREEMRSRAHLDDSLLNIAIDRAENDRNEGIAAVRGVIQRFWELALGINV